MNKKFLYVIIAIIFIVAIVLTAVFGLRVDLDYAEANLVTFSVQKTISLSDIQKIADEVFGKNKTLVQEVEMFGDSAVIKTREEITDEKLNNLCAKLNEKYEVELTTDGFEVAHTANTKLRNVLEPYIVPVGLSVLLISAYFAIRFKDTAKLVNLLQYLVLSEGLLYSAYAIIRIPVNELTMPLAMLVYGLVIVIYSSVCEFKTEKKKSKKSED